MFLFARLCHRLFLYLQGALLLVELGDEDGTEAGHHVDDVAGEVLAAAGELVEALGERMHEALLDLEGVVDVFDEEGDGGQVVAAGDAAHTVVVGAADLVAVGAFEFGGLDEIHEAHAYIYVAFYTPRDVYNNCKKNEE